MKFSRSEIAAVAIIGGYNWAVHRILPHATHIPGNLTAAAILIALARSDGATWEEIGIDRSQVRQGARLGVLAALPAAGVVAAGVAKPSSRRLLIEDRILDAGVLEIAYHTTIRIPLATALGEELIFRGALYALLRRGRSRWAAALMTSALFGLWHILPTLESLESRDGFNGRGAAVKAKAVAASVAATAAAGLGFTWLRDHTGSVAAPAIVHAAVNATGYAAGRSAGRRARRLAP